MHIACQSTLQYGNHRLLPTQVIKIVWRVARGVWDHWSLCGAVNTKGGFIDGHWSLFTNKSQSVVSSSVYSEVSKSSVTLVTEEIALSWEPERVGERETNYQGRPQTEIMLQRFSSVNSFVVRVLQYVRATQDDKLCEGAVYTAMRARDTYSLSVRSNVVKESAIATS